jgi:hypothetical protein
MNSLVNEFVAVLAEENGHEVILTGVVTEDDEEYLTLAYYLRDMGDGCHSREMTVLKDSIINIKVWERSEKTSEEESKQLCLPLIGGDQISEAADDAAAA